MNALYDKIKPKIKKKDYEINHSLLIGLSVNYSKTP